MNNEQIWDFGVSQNPEGKSWNVSETFVLSRYSDKKRTTHKGGFLFILHIREMKNSRSEFRLNCPESEANNGQFRDFGVSQNPEGKMRNASEGFVLSRYSDKKKSHPKDGSFFLFASREFERATKSWVRVAARRASRQTACGMAWSSRSSGRRWRH